MWQCSWATVGVDISGFIEDYVDFKFVDGAGNVLKHKKAIKVYGLADGTDVNYWTHKVKCSPKLIDRQTTSLINQKVVCHVKLEPLKSDIVPLSITLGACSNDTTAVQTADVFNTGVGITDPYIKFVLKKNKFDVDAVDLNCPLQITTKIGNTITAVPEEEDVAIKLEFYNLPLGEISTAIDNKIKEAIDDANGDVWELMTTLKEILFYASKICTLINAYYNLVRTLYSIAIFLKIKATVLTFAPGANYAVQSMATSACTKEQVAKVGGDRQLGPLNTICGWATCSKTLWGGWTNDVLSGVGKYLPEKSVTQYMNPKNSIASALWTGCIPGIIYGLDKWRQIQCMYANCLQEGVKQQGLPVMACEDQKDYAECKYVTGELLRLAVLPLLADYAIKFVKNVISNPFNLVGVAVGVYCWGTCPIPDAGASFLSCEGWKLVSLIGKTAEQITEIIDKDTWEIKDDYCDNLEYKADETASASSTGI